MSSQEAHTMALAHSQLILSKIQPAFVSPSLPSPSRCSKHQCLSIILLDNTSTSPNLPPPALPTPNHPHSIIRDDLPQPPPLAARPSWSGEQTIGRTRSEGEGRVRGDQNARRVGQGTRQGRSRLVLEFQVSPEQKNKFIQAMHSF